jgi:hypothetical protein
MNVQIATDYLAEVWPAKLRGARIGALLHPASVSSMLVHTSKILERENGKLFQLAAFFGPQHGFLGQTQANMIEWKSYEHPRLGIPVHSLYGEHREPTPAMLDGLDVLLVDLQDVGARYYIFTGRCRRACRRARPAKSDQRFDHSRPNFRSRVFFVYRTSSDSRPAWTHDRRAGAAISRGSFFEMRTLDLANEKLEARNVVRRNRIQNGYCPRFDAAGEQTMEMIRRFDFANAIAPFTRCLQCNAALIPVEKHEIINELEPLTKIYYQDFRRCTECGQIYWAGSHFEKLQERVERIRKRMTEEFATATELREDRQSKI